MQMTFAPQIVLSNPNRHHELADREPYPLLALMGRCVSCCPASGGPGVKQSQTQVTPTTPGMSKLSGVQSLGEFRVKGVMGAGNKMKCCFNVGQLFEGKWVSTEMWRML